MDGTARLLVLAGGTGLFLGSVAAAYHYYGGEPCRLEIPLSSIMKFDEYTMEIRGIQAGHVSKCIEWEVTGVAALISTLFDDMGTASKTNILTYLEDALLRPGQHGKTVAGMLDAITRRVPSQCKIRAAVARNPSFTYFFNFEFICFIDTKDIDSLCICFPIALLNEYEHYMRNLPSPAANESSSIKCYVMQLGDQSHPILALEEEKAHGEGPWLGCVLLRFPKTEIHSVLKLFSRSGGAPGKIKLI